MTTRERLFLRAGVGSIAALLLLRIVPNALRTHADRKAMVDALDMQVSESRRLLAALPGIVVASERAAIRVTALRTRAYTAGSLEEAVARLASRLGDLAEEHGVRVDRTEVSGDSVQAAILTPIGVRVLVEGDTEGLMSFLAAVESDSISQRVGGLEITSTDPVSDPTRPEVLRAELTVHAWWARP